MDKQKTKTTRLTIDFPVEEHMYLKMACARKGVKMKEFVSEAIIKSIHEYEDELDRLSIEEARKEIAEAGTISWEAVCKEMNWEP